MNAARSLSELEIAIVRALAQGLQSKEIASALERSRPTIEFHIRTLFLKMDARSRAQIVARGYEYGLLPAEPTGASPQTAARF
jgi:DNA-binding NarL/FixJ family response regulator